MFLENYLPGKLQSIGLGYSDLKTLNPRLIYCSLTGFGNRGPEMNKPGYDLTVSAIGGGLHITGEEVAGFSKKTKNNNCILAYYNGKCSQSIFSHMLSMYIV